MDKQKDYMDFVCKTNKFKTGRKMSVMDFFIDCIFGLKKFYILIQKEFLINCLSFFFSILVRLLLKLIFEKLI